jgi:hypothetical protein
LGPRCSALAAVSPPIVAGLKTLITPGLIPGLEVTSGRVITPWFKVTSLAWRLVAALPRAWAFKALRPLVAAVVAVIACAKVSAFTPVPGRLRLWLWTGCSAL